MDIHDITNVLLRAWAHMVRGALPGRPQAGPLASPKPGMTDYEADSLGYQKKSMYWAIAGVGIAIVLGVVSGWITYRALYYQTDPGAPQYVVHFQKVVSQLCEGNQTQVEQAVKKVLDTTGFVCEEAKVNYDFRENLFWFSVGDSPGKVGLVKFLNRNAVNIGVFFPKGCGDDRAYFERLKRFRVWVAVKGGGQTDEEKKEYVLLRDIIGQRPDIAEAFSAGLDRGRMADINDTLCNMLNEKFGRDYRVAKVRFWLSEDSDG